LSGRGAASRLKSGLRRRSAEPTQLTKLITNSAKIIIFNDNYAGR
jgi:hypothetical protein